LSRYEVIGGYFEIGDNLVAGPSRSTISAWGAKGEYEWFASGRCVLASILTAHADASRSGAKILIPDYTCLTTTLQSIRSARCSFEFYSGGLTGTDVDKLIAEADSHVSHILLVNYFGLFRNHGLAAKIKWLRPDITVILDCVSDVYFPVDHPSIPSGVDYMFTSYRKFLPVPDGAILRKAASAPAVRCVGLENNISSRILEAGRLKASAHDVSDADEVDERDRSGLVLYQSAISDLSKATPGILPSMQGHEILRRLDAQVIRKKRRENYEFLATELSGMAGITVLKSTLEASDVPLCLPVLVEGDERDRLRGFLQSQNVFCPVHWPLPDEFKGTMAAGARGLYDRQLSLVIDQRYKPQQLSKMIECVHSFLKLH